MDVPQLLSVALYSLETAAGSVSVNVATSTIAPSLRSSIAKGGSGVTLGVPGPTVIFSFRVATLPLSSYSFTTIG